MIEITADTKNEDIIAARGVLTAIMREPGNYGLSSKMKPLLVKLYTDVSIVPKHKATPEETESTHMYIKKYIENKFTQTPKNLFSAEITYLVMSKIWSIYKNFEKAVEKSVLIRLSKESENDIPPDILNEDAGTSLSQYLSYSSSLLDKKPELGETYNSFKREESQRHALIALGEIKLLIQTTPWELGIWGSKSKIKVDGVDKEIPGHMKKIYDKVLYAEKNPDRALAILEEIHQISRKALDDKPIFFSSFRERYKSTTQAYETINEQTNFKLN
ncbi:hypothetical protein [Legionella bozemanae]|uniref:hypothetical protein n=1 Tax=Legionella bozemanae TaxID=447 RepID=UPI0010414D9A|nr:hypothetical protein [Legionella bozemanae]